MSSIQGINYTLLHSAASSYLEFDKDFILSAMLGGPLPLKLRGQEISFTRQQLETLVRVLGSAKEGNRAAFESNPDFVAQAYCILAAAPSNFQSHPSASQTLNALRPIASQSTWARHTAGSSGIFGTAAAFTGQLRDTGNAERGSVLAQQQIPKGGIVVRVGDKIHAIQPDAFRETYTHPDGSPISLSGREPTEIKIGNDLLVKGAGDVIARTQAVLGTDSIDRTAKGLIDNYPEMLWLTGDVHATPEGVSGAGQGKLVSERLFGRSHTEFDRTTMGIEVLKWVIRGDNSKLNLSPAHFEQLRNHTLGALEAQQNVDGTISISAEALDALLTSLVVNDLGKVKGIVKAVATEAGIDTLDHDVVLAKLLERAPGTIPSFARLTPIYKTTLLESLATAYNHGQTFQGENIPASLSALEGMSQSAWDVYYLHWIYDFSGATGHVTQDRSLTLTDQNYHWLGYTQSVWQTVNANGPVAAYNAYLEKRAQEYDWRIIAINSELRALTRLACQMRLPDAASAQKLRAVFNTLPENVKAVLVHELNRTGVGDGQGILLYYSPATFSNAQGALKAAGDPQPFEHATRLVLMAFARAYQEARMGLLKENSGIYILDVTDLANQAKVNPNDLALMDFDLNEAGDGARLQLTKHQEIDLASFAKVDSLGKAITGQRLALVGIGGGSDIIQTAILAEILQKEGRDVPAIISVRQARTGSQGSSGSVGEQRTITHHGGEIRNGVYRVLRESSGSGRFLENLPASTLPVFLIIDDGTDLTGKFQSVLDHVGGTDKIVAVDTGGDGLYRAQSIESIGTAKATPDQDLRVLQALSDLSTPVQTAEVAVGVDTPSYVQEILERAGAVYFEPSDQLALEISTRYRNWLLDGSHPSRYGKTPFAWQMALTSNRSGYQSVPLGPDLATDAKNPWKVFVYNQPAMRGIFISDLEGHLSAIGSEQVSHLPVGYIETSLTAQKPQRKSGGQAEEQLRRAYAVFKGDGARAAEFKTAVEDYLAQELGRRPSEAEVMTHLTEIGERSMLGSIRQITGASETEFSEVVEKARSAGALPKRTGAKGEGTEEKPKETPRRK